MKLATFLFLMLGTMAAGQTATLPQVVTGTTPTTEIGCIASTSDLNHRCPPGTTAPNPPEPLSVPAVPMGVHLGCESTAIACFDRRRTSSNCPLSAFMVTNGHCTPIVKLAT